MAADDAEKDTPDPWDDIVAGLGDTAAELSFNFDEPDDGPKPTLDDVPAAAEPAAEVSGIDTSPAEAAAEPDDALVDDWLASMDDAAEIDPAQDVIAGGDDAGDNAAEPPALAVFAPEDAGAAPQPTVAAFEVTDGGDEGSDEADDADLVDFLAATDAGPPADEGSPPADDADPWGALDESAEAEDDAVHDAAALGQFPTDETTDEADDGGFPGVAVAAAAGAAAAAPTTRPSKATPVRPRKKASAIRQIVGIVLGGLMAIPITLAILIWGLGKDPFKVTKLVPEQVAFLLPEKFRPGYTKPVGGGGATPPGPSLDDLPTPDPATTEPAPTDVATVDPAEPGPTGEEMPDPDLPTPDLGDVTDPAAPPEDVAIATPADPLDPPDVEPAAPPPPPPLDTSGLDAAVTEAASLVEALGAVDDSTDRTRKVLLVQWYKALARVGEQLVTLEKTAADSGRPLEETPAGVVELHGSIAAQPALALELERLGRNWLTYQKRDSHGVVLPVTFDSARRVGPYWVTKATLAEADGKPRPVSVISRAEPSAVAGDRLVFTGIVLDGDVVWAADCRTPAAAPAEPTDSLF